MQNKIVFYWFRRDLRLQDNHGLFEALKSGFKVIPVFIFDANILEKLSDPKDARVNFIHQQLKQLKRELNGIGSDIIVCHGTPEAAWSLLLEQYSSAAIYSNRDYEPYAQKRDEFIKNLAAKKQVNFLQFKDQVIMEPGEVLKEDGTPYTVYTPYSKKWKLLFDNASIIPFETEKYFTHFFSFSNTEFPSLKDLGFSQTNIAFPPQILRADIIKQYELKRDIPSANGTSKLSIHLRFGTISIRKLIAEGLVHSEKWLNEFIWREFYMQILFYFPQVENRSFKPQYDRIIWRNNETEFKAWCEGKTGYPIVDAGMRELNETGFMHNRVRMIVSSFLTKHLLIDWRWGEAYFAEKLLDYELSSNNGGWQWAAGCGVDAAPYFRIFNPSLQTQKFDPELKYIRQWVPEFDMLNYPRPIVDHAFARKRCLEVYTLALKNI